ncbi:MAG TPA: phage protease [Terriglobia bacterium]|nr:phage protease [Terriglobia bacterium]
MIDAAAAGVRQEIAGRHFAWELFSAGPSVARNGRDLHEVPVAVAGSWVKNGQKFSITHQDLLDMVRNFAKRKNDMVVIDYEHASEQPQVAQGGPIPAAGWIHSLQVSSQLHPTAGAKNGRAQSGGGSPAGTYLTALVEWTPEAKQLIEQAQYRFFSPAIDWAAQDKESGKPQGATLTSGALTNHPFLEELPPIMLTDLAKAEISDSTSQSSNGEQNMIRQLALKKLTEGALAGHHGIFEGDDLVGYMTDEDFAKYAQEHLPQVVSQQNQTKKMNELFAERVGARGAAIDEIVTLVESGRRAQAQSAEAEARSLAFDEAVKDGQLLTDRAGELAREQKITLAEYINLQAAQKAVDRAVVQGKVLPRDRKFFFRDALERPREFAEYLDKAMPVVRLGAEGIGSGESLPVDQEVDVEVKRLMSEQNVTYGKALKELLRENPGLEARYRRAHNKGLANEGPAREQ